MLDKVAPKALPSIVDHGLTTIPTRRMLTDLLIAAWVAAAAAVARIVVEHFVGGVAPFILTFPAVMIATLARGGRAGAIAAFCCQLLTIRYVFPNWISVHGGLSTSFANVLLSTIALAGIVWATASYRRAAAILRSRCERHVETLSLLIAEMDHRTKNNFQLAAGLLAHQSLATMEPGVASELDKAASRLETIALIYQHLSAEVGSGGSVALADHVDRIVALLRTGATPEHVLISYRADDVRVSNEVAVVVGLIINEWVTNALKHAFVGQSGTIFIDLTDRGKGIEITVADDGGAAVQPGRLGRGSDLMVSLADAIGATITTAYQHGTRCRLAIPTDR